MSQDEFANTTPNTLPHMLNIDIAMQQKQQGKNVLKKFIVDVNFKHIFMNRAVFPHYVAHLF